MNYHHATNMTDDGLEYHVQWRGKMDPIAVCSEHRDAVKICAALNNSPRTSCGPVSNGWIPVAEEMPDDGIMVLCYIAKTDDMRLAYHEEGKWWDGDCIIIRAGITHWCDPAPPTN